MIWPLSLLVVIGVIALIGRQFGKNLVFIPCLLLGIFSAFRGNFGTDSAPYKQLYEDLDATYLLFIEPLYWVYLYAMKLFSANYLYTQIIIAVALVLVLYRICAALNTHAWDFVAGFFATGYYAFLGGQRQAIALLVLLYVTMLISTRLDHKMRRGDFASLVLSLGFHYSAIIGYLWMLGRKHLFLSAVVMAISLGAFQEYFLPKIFADGSFDPLQYSGYKRFVPLFEISMFWLSTHLYASSNATAVATLRKCAFFGCLFAIIPWLDPQFANLSGRALLYYRSVLVLLLFFTFPPTWYRIFFAFAYTIPKAFISYDQWFFNISDWNQQIQKI